MLHGMKHTISIAFSKPISGAGWQISYVLPPVKREIEQVRASLGSGIVPFEGVLRHRARLEALEGQLMERLNA